MVVAEEGAWDERAKHHPPLYDFVQAGYMRPPATARRPSVDDALRACVTDACRDVMRFTVGISVV